MNQMPTLTTAQKKFPSWHYSMLNDRFRNGVIESAIKEIDVYGKTIVEIGTGVGLTAIFFARQKAKEIVTCEINPQIYEIAKKTIQDSGFSDTIVLLNKSSFQAINDGDIPYSSDIIFTETLDCGVIGEGFYNIARDIHLIKGPNTTILPGCINQFGMLVNSSHMYQLNSALPIQNINFEHLNYYNTKTYFPVRANDYNFHPLSEITKIKSYRYDYGQPKDEIVFFKSHVTDECHGILSYFSASYGRHSTGNNPAIPSHWHQAFHPLPEPTKLVAGTDYKFTFKFDGRVEFLGEIK